MTNGKDIILHGIAFQIRGPSLCGDGRWKCNVSIMDPRGSNQYKSSGKARKLDVRQVIARSERDAAQKAHDMIDTLYSQYTDQLLRWMQTGGYHDAPLSVYFELRKDEIRRRRRWAGRANDYTKLWDNKLSKAIGAMSIADVGSRDKMATAMDNLTRRSARQEYTEEERMCWVVVDDILWMMVQDGILPTNPIADKAGKHHKALTQNALANLRRNSLSQEEAMSMLSDCLDRMQSDGHYAAAAVRLLTGMTVYEVAALNCGDWRAGIYVTWIEVTKAYKQVRGAEPVLTNILDSSNAYRCIPCSFVLERLLARQLVTRNCNDSTAPLFVDTGGSRITPESLKAVEKALKLAHISIDSPLRTSSRGKRFDGTLKWSDTLRGAAAHNYRYCAHLTTPEASCLLGIRRQTTFGERYVDWCSEPVLMQIKRKVDRWHNSMVDAVGELTCRSASRTRGMYISGSATEGARIMIFNADGVSGYIDGGNIDD